jgi:hypothetical protein
LCARLPGRSALRWALMRSARKRGRGARFAEIRDSQNRLAFAGLAGFIHDLRIVLVEVETGVKLRLPHKKVFQAGVVLEGAAQLRAVIGEGLLLPLDFKLFILGVAIEAAEGVLDALNRTQRILGVEIGLVGLFAPDEQIRLAVLICTAAAQYLEALEC